MVKKFLKIVLDSGYHQILIKDVDIEIRRNKSRNNRTEAFHLLNTQRIRVVTALREKKKEAAPVSSRIRTLVNNVRLSRSQGA